jgi:glycosyltransferase involved in cell wall biosynthesis
MISIVIISKDEPSLQQGLEGICRQVSILNEDAEILVVDSSDGRLDYIKGQYKEDVIWLDFKQPPGIRTTIPHQRNAGVRAARGDVIVFTDAGCTPEPGWLERIIAPLACGERMTHGPALGTVGGAKFHDRLALLEVQSTYLVECSTINTAFRREVYDVVGGFDETFAYGSDVDFSWRVIDAGFSIRSAPDAIVRHDWGSGTRHSRRAYVYGKARTRLYRKHPRRLRQILRHDPMVVFYPLFLLGLPLTLIFPLYPALLIIPAWRNREDGSLRVVLDNLTFGAGVLVELFTRRALFTARNANRQPALADDSGVSANARCSHLLRRTTRSRPRVARIPRIAGRQRPFHYTTGHGERRLELVVSL